MDPQLREQLHEAAPEEELELLLRLRPGPPPPRVRIITRFGDVATVRLRAADVPMVYADASVISMKPASAVRREAVVTTKRARPGGAPSAVAESVGSTDVRRPDGVVETGRGVVVGVIDWGCDITHPDLRHEDGTTRLLSLWDQSGSAHAPAPWGYGTAHDQAALNRALATPDPFATLRYDVGHTAGRGAHGTHVTGIAAGNGRGGGPLGLAPEAELVFVHLAGTSHRGLQNLGNSVRILEAVDFVLRVAGTRACVINLSVGAHGGPHDGTTLLERGFDAALQERPGRAICQSAGNYYSKRIHTARRVVSGERWSVPWDVAAGDPTDNELELWYPGSDRLVVTLRDPAGAGLARVTLGEDAPLRRGGRTIGHIYHRRRDPNNHDHLVNVFLAASAPTGRWVLDIQAVDVQDGRCHLWIERDHDRPLTAQSRFPAELAVGETTTGTIANGRAPLSVGAFDPHDPSLPIADFSSAGPTRDGRAKPDVLAPGVRSLAASSHWRTTGLPHERHSGTSMAAPVVTGLVALLFEAAGASLTMAELRRLVLTTARQRSGDLPVRSGHGRVDVRAALTAARRRTAPAARPGPRQTSVPSPPRTGESVETIVTREVPPPPALDAWRGLLSFVPPPLAASRGHADVGGIRLHPIGSAWGPVNLDLYTVVIEHLPGPLTPTGLLQRVRTDLNRFVDTRISQFTPAGRAAAARWHSSDPVGSVVHIDMFASLLGYAVNVDDGSVLCAQAAPDHWVFSTIWTPTDLGHPVSGNRLFGIVPSGSEHLLFTMAADRLTSAADLGGEHALGAAFAAADRLWRSLQRGVVRYVTAAGGRARLSRVHSARYPWDDVHRVYGGPPVTSIVPRLP